MWRPDQPTAADLHHRLLLSVFGSKGAVPCRPVISKAFMSRSAICTEDSVLI